MTKRPSTLKGFKSHAKRMKKALGIAHANALNCTAREFGFRDYYEAHRHYLAHEGGAE